MKYLDRFTSPLLIILFTLPFYITGCNSAGTVEESSTTDTSETTPVNEIVLDDEVSSLPVDNVSAEETIGLDATAISHLTFMREEEKLARDVYLTLADLYPDQQAFS